MTLEGLIRKGFRFESTRIAEKYEHYWMLLINEHGNIREDFHDELMENEDSADQLAEDEVYFRFMNFVDNGGEL